MENRIIDKDNVITSKQEFERVKREGEKVKTYYLKLNKEDLNQIQDDKRNKNI